MLAASILERDRNLKRNFREETITDLLMASLVGLEPFGIKVDFPDEAKTGADMDWRIDWFFVAPMEGSTGKSLRLHLQAKRPVEAKRKKGNFWYYQHLDHGTPPGSQAATLMKFANSPPDGIQTLPLYILYHPTSALSPARGKLPAIEGVNLVLADTVAAVVKTGIGLKEKRIDFWRKDFLPLSDLLCWPVIVDPIRPPPSGATQLLSRGLTGFLRSTTGAFHPDLVADVFQRRRDQARVRSGSNPDPVDTPSIRASEGIPADIRRSISGEATPEDRKSLKRPRVIFTTTLTREDTEFPRSTDT